MKLNSEILDKLMNSPMIKSVYQMVDRIETEVEDDGDEIQPYYTIMIDIYLNDDTINSDNMYRKGMDPHYLVDFHAMPLLKMIGFSPRDIEQIYINVFDTDKDPIYPS